MKNNTIYFSLILFIVCILSISAINATENATNKDFISVDDNSQLNLEENNDKEESISLD